VGDKPAVFYFCIMDYLKKPFFALLTIFLIIACSGDSDENIDQVPQFDRSTILENYANNIIIPRHNDFKSEQDNLKIAVDNFTQTPNTTNFDQVHDKWLSAYKKWQHIEMFNIGKAEEIYYLNTINTYPVDEDRIKENITSKRYDLSNTNDWSCQGLSGIDYMLHGIGSTKEEVIQKYINDPKYADYLKNLLVIMNRNTNDVVESWASDKSSFIQSSGNSNSSSLNMLTNDFIYYFEKGLRSIKIGTPAGYWSAGRKLPHTIEAYYSSKNAFEDVSKVLAKEALTASENLFLGKSLSGSLGASLKTYLDYLHSSKVSDNNLSPIIVANFKNAHDAIDQLNSNFIDQIDTGNEKMLNAFDNLQTLVRNFKTDMLSVLSIQVDYIDADGD
jgi:predicted lipoprotein